MTHALGNVAVLAVIAGADASPVAPPWVPPWLANCETAVAGAGADVQVRWAVLAYFAAAGMRWLDRTHVADNIEARRVLQRAVDVFTADIAWHETAPANDSIAFPIYAFTRRCHNLLRSLKRGTPCG